MDDALINRSFALVAIGGAAGLLLGPLAAWLWRRALRLAEASALGMAVGVGVFALGMVLATLPFGQAVWPQQPGVAAEGRLLGFATVTVQQKKNAPRVTSQAPQVEFSTPDGRRHVVQGLGGSLARHDPDQPVPLRYDPANPQRAQIGDFQNQFGALWLFSTLSGAAVLIALYFAAAAVQDLRKARAARAPVRAGQRPRPPSAFVRWRDGSGQRFQRSFQRVGWLSLFAALAAPFLVADDGKVGRALALALAGIAVAITCLAVAAALKRGADAPMLLFGRFIGVATLASFAFGLWVMSGG
jgi:hypothetical protein